MINVVQRTRELELESYFPVYECYDADQQSLSDSLRLNANLRLMLNMCLIITKYLCAMLYAITFCITTPCSFWLD